MKKPFALIAIFSVMGLLLAGCLPTKDDGLVFNTEKIGYQHHKLGYSYCRFRVTVTNNTAATFKKISGSMIYFDLNGNQIGSGHVYEHLYLPPQKTATFMNDVNDQDNGEETCRRAAGNKFVP